MGKNIPLSRNTRQ